jgi:hypothetical protein
VKEAMKKQGRIIILALFAAAGKKETQKSKRNKTEMPYQS